MDVSTEAPSASPEVLAVAEAAMATGDTATAAPVEGDSKGSLLDAVKAAIEPKEAPEATAEATAQPEEKAAETPEAQAEGEKEPDDKLLPFHTHPRFKQLTRERREFKEKAESLEKRFSEEVEPLRTDATHYQNIVGYMRSNDLSMAEVNEGFEIMATMKNDPLRCLELLRPRFIALQRFAGEVLPDDLMGKVESGEVEEAFARQAAAHRHQAEFERQKREQMEQAMRQDHERIAREGQMNAIVGALAQWEGQVKSSDPDYAKKEEFVLAELRSIHATQPPRTPQEARANAQAAYDRVTSRLSALRPAPTPAVPTSSASSITGARAEPKTALEAARMAIRR